MPVSWDVWIIILPVRLLYVSGIWFSVLQRSFTLSCVPCSAVGSVSVFSTSLQLVVTSQASLWSSTTRQSSSESVSRRASSWLSNNLYRAWVILISLPWSGTGSSSIFYFLFQPVASWQFLAESILGVFLCGISHGMILCNIIDIIYNDIMTNICTDAIAQYFMLAS